MFRAIALSLVEARTSLSGSTKATDAGTEHRGDTSDDEDQKFQRDLRRVIETSKVESQERHTINPTPSAQATQAGMPTSSGSTKFLSERAHLEKERLARLKRYRGESDDHGGQTQQPPVKRPHLLSGPTDRRVTQLRSTPSISSSSSSSSIHGRSDSKTTEMQTVPVIDQLFWDGELRPTANRHSQPREDGKATFRLSEVLGPVRAQWRTLSPA